MFMRKKENELQIDWKHFYLSVLALVIPMALQNLINVGVTAADVVMLGRVGETALSGSSLAGQVQYIMTLFLSGQQNLLHIYCNPESLHPDPDCFWCRY